MHLHHLVLRSIAQLLDREWKGAILGEIFTQDKDELIIGLGKKGEDLWLRVGCMPSNPYVWPLPVFNKAKKNVLDLFPEIRHVHLLRAYSPEWERAIVLEWEGGFRLVLKMHGIMSNVILLGPGEEGKEEVLGLFRHVLEKDWAFSISNGTFHPEKLTELNACEKDEALSRLKEISPALEANIREKLGLEMDGGHSFLEAWDRMLGQAAHDQWTIRQRENKLQFLPWPLEGTGTLEIKGLVTALDRFFRSKMAYQSYAQKHSTFSKELETHLKRAEGLAESYRESSRQIQSERDQEEIGNLILAQLHLLRPGMEEIELQDFYQEGTLKIKLRPDLNPQQNAEHFFQKQKKLKGRIKALVPLQESADAKVRDLSALLTQFQQFPLPSQIAVGPDGLEPPGILRHLVTFFDAHFPSLNPDKKNQDGDGLPYWEFSKMGYRIWVGKNAKMNDKLTFFHAGANDTWMHARGVTGSHVIIRTTGIPGKIPQPVLEFAGGLAAWYSKSRTEGLVPVQFCLRKHVRKVKNGAPGQVTLFQEQVVLVPPTAP